MRNAGGILMLAVALAACAPEPARRSAGDAIALPVLPESDYAAAARRGERVFRVDPGSSLVTIEVRRGGSLARLGHDHVVASHDVQGYVAPDAGRADLHVRLDRLTVDEPALRDHAGFETQPSAEDIAATRENMLSKVLEADRFALAEIHITGNAAGGGSPMQVAITLHGSTRTVAVPVTLDSRDNALEATGEFTVRQTDFGITPYAALGGAIRVEDPVLVRFRIRALSDPRCLLGC